MRWCIRITGKREALGQVRPFPLPAWLVFYDPDAEAVVYELERDLAAVYPSREDAEAHYMLAQAANPERRPLYEGYVVEFVDCST